MSECALVQAKPSPQCFPAARSMAPSPQAPCAANRQQQLRDHRSGDYAIDDLVQMYDVSKATRLSDSQWRSRLFRRNKGPKASRECALHSVRHLRGDPVSGPGNPCHRHDNDLASVDVLPHPVPKLHGCQRRLDEETALQRWPPRQVFLAISLTSIPTAGLTNVDAR